MNKSTIASLVSEAIECESYLIEHIAPEDVEEICSYIKTELNRNEETAKYYYSAMKSGPMNYEGEEDFYNVKIEMTEFYS